MKIVFFTLCVLFNTRFVVAQKSAFDGQSFQASTGAICKEFISGGCMLYTYQKLTFKGDSVEISFPVTANCTDAEKEINYSHLYDALKKRYCWENVAAKIVIDGLNSGESLTNQCETLVAKNGLIYHRLTDDESK